jgi:hypothetical protein
LDLQLAARVPVGLQEEPVVERGVVPAEPLAAPPVPELEQRLRPQRPQPQLRHRPSQL